MEIKSWRQRPFDAQISQTLAETLHLPGLVCDILAARGMDTPQRASAFLGESAGFFDPFLMADMEKAVGRIHKAVEQGELIAIFGDFDCDGITSTVVLYHYLESVGANVTYYIPQREEGYGLSRDSVDFMKKHGVGLIITVDNGVSAIEEVDYAASLGLDVVVTDHHTPRECLPRAVAVINPHRDDDGSPFRNLAGVGVTFKLICALEGDDGEGVIDQYGDVICLGTMADIVQLAGENRAIVRRGVPLLGASANPGLNALLSVSGVDPGELTSQSVIFSLVPRINATGRMGSVDDAVELLLCDDLERAMELARKLDALNADRKGVEAEIWESILERLKAEPLLKAQRMLILAGEGWHHGVVGIVASRLVERFGKPCLLISMDGDEARGSGRSVEGFNLVEAISACSGRLTRYGGHNQAAGCSLRREDVEGFTRELLDYCAKYHDAMPAQTMVADRELSPAEITPQTAQALGLLEPFGAGNPTPLFVMKSCRLESIIPVREGKHLRLRLSKDGQSFFAMYFHMSPQRFAYVPGELVEFICELYLNEFNGERRANLKIRDIRLSGLDQESIQEGKRQYDKYLRGEPVPPQLAESWVPTRDEVAQVYRELKSRQKLEYGCEAGYARLGSRGLGYIKAALIVELLLERGLASLKEEDGMVLVALVPMHGKVDLTQSSVYDKIESLKLV